MPSLKEVRVRIASVASTQQITKAMKMVAAAKLRRAQDGIIQLRPYSQKLAGILDNLKQANDSDLDSPYLLDRVAEKILVVVITSDRGLCGAFNSNVIKTTLALLENKYSSQLAKGQVTFLCVGKKGYEYFSKRGYKVVGDYATLFGNLNFIAVSEAAEFAMNGFVNGTYDKVELVYNEFKNVATQILRTETLLPLQNVASTPRKAKTNINYLFEPSAAYIISELIPKSLKITFYKALLDSFASEHGARMTAMDKATDNAGELLKELKLTYNRTRQAAITKEILEIVGGAEALASQ
jgi:F-type H+-transporting ATPase subunit gamma